MKIKTFILRQADLLRSWCGSGGIRSIRSGPIILTYHRILSDHDCKSYPLRSLAIPRLMFEQQMEWLSVHTDVLTIDQALTQDLSHRTRPVVCVSFDDGYEDNFEASRTLDRLGIKGTFFVALDLIQGRPLWYDIAAVAWSQRPRVFLSGLMRTYSELTVDSLPNWMIALKRMSAEKRSDVLEALQYELEIPNLYRGMTSEQVRLLVKAGHEVGCHSISHPRLEQLGTEARIREIADAKQEIESICGECVRGFCYPDGSFNQDVRDLVQSSGYEYACTTLPGINKTRFDPFMLRRMEVTARRTSSDGQSYDSLLFEYEISGSHEWVRW